MAGVQGREGHRTLRRMLSNYARVLRDGKESRILAEDLVPGDVIFLGEGDRVSADARLVKDANLMIDQSSLTGESMPVRKSSAQVSEKEDSNLIFAGTSVTRGSRMAVVFATGMQTEFGNIARLTLKVGQEPSPLEKELKT